MCSFKEISKEQKAALKDYLEDCDHNWGFPLCLQFGIVQTELNFRNNKVEANDKITCDDLIEYHMDHIYLACLYCGDQNYDLDVAAAYRPMCDKFHHTKQPVLRDYTK